jgi:deazaflavin-dependent oxidoreductase (nitroreductase family)
MESILREAIQFVADLVIGHVDFSEDPFDRCGVNLASQSSPTYNPGMPLIGEYEPSPARFVREQVATYEASGGTAGNLLRNTDLPVVIVTTRGNKSGKIRKAPLMRVEYEGEYALIGSMGGLPTNPVWYYNLMADPEALEIQDGPEPREYVVHEASGDERKVWWERAVKAFPPYAEYQEKTDRTIPVLIASPKA